MKDTTAIGSLSEAMVLAALLKQGYQVYVPFSGSSRSDLICERNKSLLRVQCKTGRLRRGCMQFRTYSVTGAGKKIYSAEEVDAFGVYCPDNAKTYLIPLAQCGRQITNLRVTPRGNKHLKGAQMAEPYEI